MTVGLPGVGLGGIFYLVSALLMPVREAARLGRGGDGSRRWLVVRQLAMAAAILVAMWATGWLLGCVIGTTTPAGGAVPRGVSAITRGNVLRVSALALSLGTLAVVLTSVQGARLVVRLQRGRVTQRKELSRSSLSEDTHGLRVDSGTFGRSR